MSARCIRSYIIYLYLCFSPIWVLYIVFFEVYHDVYDGVIGDAGCVVSWQLKKLQDDDKQIGG